MKREWTGRMWVAWLTVVLTAWPAVAAEKSGAEPEEEAVESAAAVMAEPVSEAGSPVAGEAEPDAARTQEEGEGGRSGVKDPLVVVGGDLELKKGERASEIVVVFGDALIHGDVEGNVVVVWGTAEVNGKVFGNLVAPMTTLKLGPEAHIKGELVAIGGTLDAAETAKVDGEKVTLTWDELEDKIPGLGMVKSMLEGLRDWFVSGPMLGRFLPHQWGWWWWVALAVIGVYLLCGLVFQKAVASTVTVLREEPVLSFLTGILGYVGGCAALFVLLATGFGVLVVPFLMIACLAIQLLGKVAVCQGLGQQIGHQTGVGALERPLPALAAGVGLLTLLAVVPVLGMLLVFLTAPLGFGAMLLAAFRSSDRRPRPPGPVPAPMQSGVGASISSDVPLAAGVPPTLGGEPPVLGTSHGIAAAPVGDTELLGMARAGFWVRLAATFLDLILVMVVCAPLGLVDYFLVPWFVYHVGFWTWRGTTVGGIILGLRIVRRDGQKLSFVVALVRSLASVLSFVVACLGFFWAGWSEDKTAWHDLVAGTVMIKLRRGTPLV